MAKLETERKSNLTQQTLRKKYKQTETVRDEQMISDAGWSKLDFSERYQYRPVLLRLLLARNLEKPVMSLGTEWRERGFRLSVRRIGAISDVK